MRKHGHKHKLSTHASLSLSRPLFKQKGSNLNVQTKKAWGINAYNTVKHIVHIEISEQLAISKEILCDKDAIPCIMANVLDRLCDERPLFACTTQKKISSCFILFHFVLCVSFSVVQISFKVSHFIFLSLVCVLVYVCAVYYSR